MAPEPTSSSPPPGDPGRAESPSDPLYRLILLLLGLDIVAGAVLMLLGHYRLLDPAFADVGFGLGLLGGVAYLALRWWGRRRTRQLRAPARRDGGR